MDIDELDIGPKTWGVIFLIVLLIAAGVSRALANCCLQSQRNKLRDDYEREYREGGKMVNALLLPRTNRVPWEPRGPHV
jgi:hypothetical protein